LLLLETMLLQELLMKCQLTRQQLHALSKLLVVCSLEVESPVHFVHTDPLLLQILRPKD
jgi:hypothetical protein